jgi:Flp pilus assembly protein TadD/uncharacterized caspase-like protein
LPGRAPLSQRIDQLPPERRADARRELDATANLQDLAGRVARAVTLEKYGFNVDAIAEYRAILDAWPDAMWAESRIFADGQSARGVRSLTASGTGKTYALLVGISSYEDKTVPALQFAHADAELLAQHLRSPRGGSLSDREITVLLNEKATIAAMRNAIHSLLQRKVEKQDTVLLFFAAHGMSTGKDGYILAHDSDPQDLKDTALSMSEVQDIFEHQLSAAGRVILYVDVCHAGLIGSIHGNKINQIVADMAEENDIFGMLATHRDEPAQEGLQYGGHGVFSRYLVEALSGNEADLDHNGVIDAGEVTVFVSGKVLRATDGKQHPREIGSAGGGMILADTRQTGIDLTRLLPSVTVASNESAELRGVGGDATTDLDSAEQESRRRVALENRGQRVLLQYLKGEQAPQTKADFLAAADDFAAARQLTPESLLLEAREDFCRGRAALFDKDYAVGIPLLERAARIDAAAAYPFNALGIAYLEQANFTYARLAFLDAIRRAPYWAYPRHNLALTYLETGDYEQAIRVYQEAIRLAPHYAYLPYNLGLVYQRVNRRDAAEAAFRQAIGVDAQFADAYNALGYLDASYGRNRDAERFYREALSKDPNLLPARQNLAVLLARDPARIADALAEWRKVLAVDADYIPSLLSRAKTLAATGDAAGAAADYRHVIALQPEYIAARRALAELLIGTGDAKGALEQLHAALTLSPGDAELLERQGDVQDLLGDNAGAAFSYTEAIENSGGNTRRRLKDKLNRLQRSGAVSQ